MKPRILGVIPARYGSERFPGKPLARIKGVPMIRRVYEAARQARLLDDLVVATDHEEILRCVRECGGEAELVPGDFASGTERVAALAARWSYDIVINIQGDLPLLEGRLVDELARALLAEPALESATLARRVTQVEELTRPDLVQVVMTRDWYALYFSRFPIPYYHAPRPQARGVPIALDAGSADWATWIRAHAYYRHVGLYGYRADFLRQFVALGPSALERAEGLEMLRVLENGYRMKVAITDWSPLPVDWPEDVPIVEQQLG